MHRILIINHQSKKTIIMKKSIICLGLVVAMSCFTTVTAATNSKSVAKSQIKTPIHGEATPLHVAIYKGETEFVKKLIEFGADVNEKSYGLTPLMIAARYNKVEIMKLLLANGARVNDKTEFGVDAMKYAELSNAKDAVVFLKLSTSKPVAQR